MDVKHLLYKLVIISLLFVFVIKYISCICVFTLLYYSLLLFTHTHYYTVLITMLHYTGQLPAEGVDLEAHLSTSLPFFMNGHLKKLVSRLNYDPFTEYFLIYTCIPCSLQYYYLSCIKLT